MVPVGAIGPFWPGFVKWFLWPGVALSMLLGRGGFWAASKVESSARAPRLPRFILLVSLSDILLVVSISEICGHFCSPEGVKDYCSNYFDIFL